MDFDLQKEAEDCERASIRAYDNHGEEGVNRSIMFAVQSIAASNLLIIQLLNKLLKSAKEGA